MEKRAQITKMKTRIKYLLHRHTYAHKRMQRDMIVRLGGKGKQKSW